VGGPRDLNERKRDKRVILGSRGRGRPHGRDLNERKKDKRVILGSHGRGRPHGRVGEADVEDAAAVVLRDLHDPRRHTLHVLRQQAEVANHPHPHAVPLQQSPFLQGNQRTMQESAWNFTGAHKGSSSKARLQSGSMTLAVFGTMSGENVEGQPPATHSVPKPFAALHAGLTRADLAWGAWGRPP
jgi:hypothetical protein